MTKAQTLREYIAHRKAQIEDLEKRYGQGVRPGWLSEEIMMLKFYKQDAEDELKKVEQSNAANNPTN